MDYIATTLYNAYNKRYDCYKEHQYIYNFYVNKIGNDKVIEFLYTLNFSLVNDVNLKVLKYTKRISKKTSTKITYSNELFHNILYSNKTSEEKLELFKWLDKNNFKYKYSDESHKKIYKRKIKEIENWNDRKKIRMNLDLI